MTIYIPMIMISLTFAFFSKKVKNEKIFILLAILSSLPFATVSAVRYDVGTDYLYRYVNDYNVLLNGGKIDNLEIGFKLLVRLCIFVTDNYQLLFILTSCMITSFIFYTIYRDSKNVVLSIVLYFVGAFFFQSLNMVRQYMAMSILMCSYKYLLNKKMIKWCACASIAILFHTSSIIFIVENLVVLMMLKRVKKEIFINEKLAIIMLIVLIISEPVLKYLLHFFLSLTRFNVYIGSEFDYGDLQIIPFFTNLLLYFIMLFILKRKKDDVNEKDIFYVMLQLIALVFITLGKVSFLSIRIAYFFSIFQIITIPYFANYVSKVFGKKVYVIFIIVLVLFSSMSLMWTHVIHSSDEILPYKTIFNREYEFK